MAFSMGAGRRRSGAPSALALLLALLGAVLALREAARFGFAFAGLSLGLSPLRRDHRASSSVGGDRTTAAPLVAAAALSGGGGADEAILLADAAAGGGEFSMALAAGALVAVAAAAALFAAVQGGSGERADGAREEELPPWADMLTVMQDAISGKPFDEVLLNMRERHGDAFRIYVPSLFGETIVLMGREANQFVFTEQDRNLDQALGGVVGTAVSGKKTMGTKERKSTESGKIFDKASVNFFSNKKALNKATKIFVESSEDFCDRMEREITPDANVFETLWRYVVQTNADMLYGNGENAGTIVCTTIDSINKEGLFAPQVRQAGEDLRKVLVRSYEDRVQNPEKYEGEDTMFEEFFRLSEGRADKEMLEGFQQFMLTLQLAANGNQLVTIRWLMSHVYENKELLEEVRAEVRAKLAEKPAGTTIRDFNLDDLLDLTLTNACITEAVRLHSDIPSKLTLRQAEIDMEFGGYKLPKGSTIFLYADAVHKDERYFPKSASFCPHRYTDPQAFNKMQMDREIVTFGHGRKRCTGELHARAQISALLASFVMRFDMDLKTNEPDNRIPEDHDGPFVFDTANSVCLVNLRKRTEDQDTLAGGASAKKTPAMAAAAVYAGRRVEAAQRPPPQQEEALGELREDASSKGSCPFAMFHGGE
mmetsp:Transcript_11343/g.28562  ORF Transcript_11343/g.28562 Transcript_11343/m.28562 type:complete len:653 (+) Transcript_11343:78-2036(+)